MLLVLAGLGAAVMGWRMGLIVDGSPGAGLMPFASACLLAGLALASLPGGGVSGTGTDARDDSAADDSPAGARARWYVAAILVMCVLPPLCGSILAFATALTLMIHFGEGRPWRGSLAWSLGMSVVTVAGFRYVLGVPLPEPLLVMVVGY